MDAEFVEEFDRFIQSARIESAMSVENFLNPTMKHSFTHLRLTDGEILDVVPKIEEDEDQEAKMNSHHPILVSLKKEIISLTKVIAFVEDVSDSWKSHPQDTVRYSRRMQRDLRREMAGEEQRKLKQTSITEYFN